MDLKNIIQRIIYGDSISDAELDAAIKHYKTLVEHLAVHGTIYELTWKDAYFRLRTLEQYKQSREHNKKAP